MIDLTDDLPTSVPPRQVAEDVYHLLLSFWEDMLYKLATLPPPLYEEYEEGEMFEEGFLFREDWTWRGSDVDPTETQV